MSVVVVVTVDDDSPPLRDAALLLSALCRPFLALATLARLPAHSVFASIVESFRVFDG